MFLWLCFSNLWSLSGVAFASAFLFSLALMPLFRTIALKLGIMDRPGGRKEHIQATPLLGGAAIVLAGTLALLVVEKMDLLLHTGDEAPLLQFGDILYIFLGSLIIFFTGLIDDLVGEHLAFYYKLAGQILGSLAAMIFLFYAPLAQLLQSGAPLAKYAYLFVFLLWMLTIINSFNFSDNCNGLSSGLSLISVLIAVVYFSSLVNARFVVLALMLGGAVLGFLPFNFPKARIFLGDSGSLFIGYWMGVILWPMASGFMDKDKFIFGLDHLIPPALVMAVPLYDAAFVVFMRWREKRPIYLGDNKHLSHRMIRSGLSRAESVLMLWGFALIVGGIGAISLGLEPFARYLALLIAIVFLFIVTMLVMRKERQTALGSQKGSDAQDKTSHGSRRIRTNVPS